MFIWNLTKGFALKELKRSSRKSKWDSPSMFQGKLFRVGRMAVVNMFVLSHIEGFMNSVNKQTRFQQWPRKRLQMLSVSFLFLVFWVIRFKTNFSSWYSTAVFMILIVYSAVLIVREVRYRVVIKKH